MKSIVAIMAHPDDIEIHIAGTLLLLREKGCIVHFVTACNGDVGSMELPREEIARRRAAEARAAADRFGATYDGLGVGDLRLTFDPEIKSRMVEVLRRYQADIVITHPPADYMADHEITSALTREACFAAPARNWPCPGSPAPPLLPHIPELYYSDPTSLRDRRGELVPADFIVDISSVMDEKAALLACHDSQRSWLRSQHGEDNYINSMKEWGRLRGTQAGFTRGEGFVQHLGYPFPAKSTIRELIGAQIYQSQAASRLDSRR